MHHSLVHETKRFMEKNYGLILENPPIREWRVGGVSGIEKVVIKEDGDYSDHLPIFERQSYPSFDTMSCVSFSLLNVLEIIIKCKFGYIVNFSDRYTAKMSQTTKDGNTFYAVAESVRQFHGALSQTDYPNDAKSWDEFFIEIPVTLIEKGKEIYKKFIFRREYFEPTAENIREYLKYSPIWTCGYAWPTPVNGVYPRSVLRPNHAFTIYKAYSDGTFGIFDHYNEPGTKRLASDYIFSTCYIWTVEEIKQEEPINTMKFEEGTLYQLVEGNGGFYLMAAGKLRKDDETKLLLTFIMRAKETPDGGLLLPRKTLLLKDLEGVKMYDLKGNEV